MATVQSVSKLLDDLAEIILKSGEKPEDVDVDVHAPDGSVIWVEATWNHVKDEYTVRLYEH